MREPITDKEIESAYRAWCLGHYKHQAADRTVAPFLKVLSQTGWIRLAREALFLSQRKAASRAGISLALWHRLESSETAGKVRLEYMIRCAQAINCDFVYAIRPRSQQAFSHEIWKSLLPDIRDKELLGLSPPGRMRIARIVDLARSRMYTPEFRRSNGWSLNTDPDAHTACWVGRALRSSSLS